MSVTVVLRGIGDRRMAGLPAYHPSQKTSRQSQTVTEEEPNTALWTQCVRIYYAATIYVNADTQTKQWSPREELRYQIRKFVGKIWQPRPLSISKSSCSTLSTGFQEQTHNLIIWCTGFLAHKAAHWAMVIHTPAQVDLDSTFNSATDRIRKNLEHWKAGKFVMAIP